jgi:hypothetical protein
MLAMATSHDPPHCLWGRDLPSVSQLFFDVVA